MLFILLCLILECIYSSAGQVQLQKTFKRNNGLIILPSVFDKIDVVSIGKEVVKLKKHLKIETGSIAVGRRGVHIPHSSDIYSLFYKDKVMQRVIRSTGHNLMQEEDLTLMPLELRVYPVGSYMPMHADESLFHDKPQLEFIYTVENEADCKFQWIDVNNVLHSEWIEPNSLVLIQANAVVHGVTRVCKPIQHKTIKFHFFFYFLNILFIVFYM